MRFFRKVNANLWLALVILASITSNYSLAQTQHGSFLTINGGLSGGHISTKSEGNSVAPNPVQTLGSINFGWFNYWQHLSAEAQFTVSPFVSSFTNSSNLTSSGIKTMGIQFWVGYSVFDNDIFRVSPTIGFGSFSFRRTAEDYVTNAHVNLSMSGEVFIPESRILLGLRAGYQHNFVLPTGVDATSANAGGAVVQVRTGIRIF